MQFARRIKESKINMKNPPQNTHVTFQSVHRTNMDGMKMFWFDVCLCFCVCVNFSKDSNKLKFIPIQHTIQCTYVVHRISRTSNGLSEVFGVLELKTCGIVNNWLTKWFHVHLSFIEIPSSNQSELSIR